MVNSLVYSFWERFSSLWKILKKHKTQTKKYHDLYSYQNVQLGVTVFHTTIYFPSLDSLVVQEGEPSIIFAAVKASGACLFRPNLFVRARPSPLDTCIAVTSVLAPIHFHEFHTIYKQENSHNNNKRFFLFLSFPKRDQELACHWGGVLTGNDQVKELRLFPRGIVFDAIIFLCERAIVWLAEYFIYSYET